MLTWLNSLFFVPLRCFEIAYSQNDAQTLSGRGWLSQEKYVPDNVIVEQYQCTCAIP